MAEVTEQMEAELTAWENKYKPIQNPFGDNGWNGTMFETYDEQFTFVQAAPEANVWTWVDGDEGTWLMSGLHWVNRIGYFVTENPLEEDFVEIQIDIYEDFDEEETL
jgi:hypothetical protein